MRATLVALLVLIAGCQETQHCGPGLYGRNCDQSLTTQPDSGARDSGMDGGIESDTGVDAATPDAFTPMDAGPCGETCPAERPECFIAPVGADAGHASGCVECLTNEDCRDGDAGMTDGGTLGRQFCVDFVCELGCEIDDDCGPTGACRPDGQCSEFPRGREVCLPCDTDANCMGALRCVAFTNAGHAGSYCLANDSGLACADRRRFTATLSGVSSVDGATVDDYCTPSAVTCEAVLAADTACATSATCGLVGATATGSCFGATYCTYACNTAHVNNDCPISMTCDGSLSTCVR